MNKFRADLYKNRNECIYAGIPLEWFSGDISFKFDDVSEFELNIPRYYNNKKNIVYDMISSKQQLVINHIDGKKYRFMLIEDKGSYNSKKDINRVFKGYSFNQRNLQGKRIEISEGDYSLYSTDSDNKGILNILADKIGYKIKTVEKSAIQTTGNVLKSTVLYPTTNGISSTSGFQYGDVFFEINTPMGKKYASYGNSIVELMFTYKDISCLGITQTIRHTFSKTFEYIESIKAEFCNENGCRNGIKYTITHYTTNVNGSKTKQVEEISKPFISIVGITGTICSSNNITCTYTDGTFENATITVVNTIQEIDDNAYSFIKTLEDLYDCIIVFDEMDKSFSCYSRNFISDDNYYGTVSGEISCKSGIELNENNILSININETDNLISGLKVIGKDDDTNIIAYNPYGTNIIYNLDKYSDGNTLSADTITQWGVYQNLLKSKQAKYKELSNQLSLITSQLTSIETQYTTKTNRFKTLENLLNTLKEADETESYNKYLEEQTEVQKELDNLTYYRQSLTTKKVNLTNERIEIAKSMNMKNIKDNNGNKVFTEDMLNEIDDVLEIDVYNDDTFTDGASLYTYSVDYLKEKIKNHRDFTMTMEDIKKYLKINNNLLRLGDLFILDNLFTNLLNEKYVRLISYKYSPITNDITECIFSNKTTQINRFNSFKNQGRQIYRQSLKNKMKTN